MVRSALTTRLSPPAALVAAALLAAPVSAQETGTVTAPEAASEVQADEKPSPTADEKSAAEAAPGDAEASAEGDESFGEAMTRIFLKTLEAPLDWSDPDNDPGAVCVAPSSAEAIDQSVLTDFAEAVDAAWERPSAAGGGEPPSILLEICLNAEGRVLRRPRLIEPDGPLEPEQSAALLKALAAVETAAPFSGLPDVYTPWRRILVLFDPLKGRSERVTEAEETAAPDAPPTE